jgi:hypothetical protein
VEDQTKPERFRNHRKCGRPGGPELYDAQAKPLTNGRRRRSWTSTCTAFDFARCLEVLRRFGRSAGNAAARQREAGTDEHDLRSLARKLLANVCRGDPDGLEYSASGGLLALRDGQQLRLCFVAEEMRG